jgi:CheY-like chemotaxis protein/anti-sigma regulatory factor (Ser/Thr protein kinase)
LRTPLTAILLWAKMLKTGDVEAAEYAEVFDTIERCAGAQQQLIEDLLDVSRMMSGKLRLNVRDAEVLSVVRAAVDAVRPAADAGGVTLHASLDPRSGRASIDPDRLQQVVWNLLNNAVKFTGRGGRVEVTLRRLDGELEIRVNDTGSGISPEFLPHLFERFRQADASTTRTHGGLGLGLAITRQLVELHGGSIRAESPGVGRGSMFTVRLPAAGAQPARADAPPPPPDAAFEPTPVLEGLRVLLVEDEPATRKVIQWMLEQCRAEVTAVPSAALAVAAFRECRRGGGFDVLLSDIGMPGQDGYEQVREIRELERQAGDAPPLPAVALTAYAGEEDRTKAEAAGFQAHVSKPVEPQVLISTIARLARRAPAASPPLRSAN